MMSTLNPTRRALMFGAASSTVALLLARPAPAAEALSKMIVTRDPNCGCCGGWIAHVKAAGFAVEVVEATDLAPLKARLGVPSSLAACHTAQIGGYAIEGHVPAGAIRRLIAERPEARGLAVAGMPLGSPGMESPGSEPETYDVVLFTAGSQQVFARYRGIREIS